MGRSDHFQRICEASNLQILSRSNSFDRICKGEDGGGPSSEGWIDRQCQLVTERTS